MKSLSKLEALLISQFHSLTVTYIAQSVQCPDIRTLHYIDTSLYFNKHSGYIAERVSSRNNIRKTLVGTSWGQHKETLLMTYNVEGGSIIKCAAPVWSTNLRDTNYRNIQYKQNEALRMIATGCHKMSSVDLFCTQKLKC